jgi:hypothetical protein
MSDLSLGKHGPHSILHKFDFFDVKSSQTAITAANQDNLLIIEDGWVHSLDKVNIVHIVLHFNFRKPKIVLLEWILPEAHVAFGSHSAEMDQVLLDRLTACLLKLVLGQGCVNHDVVCRVRLDSHWLQDKALIKIPNHENVLLSNSQRKKRVLSYEAETLDTFLVEGQFV